jgi:hypothetical protein
LLAGGVGTIAAVVGLVFVFFPDAKPTATEKCTARGAELSKVVSKPAPRKTYLARLGASTQGMTRERLNEAGQLVTFDVATEGYLNERLIVATRVLTTNEAPVSELGIENPRAVDVIPKGCKDESHYQVWSPLPTKPGRYKVELRLLDPNGKELRVEETRVFTI